MNLFIVWFLRLAPPITLAIVGTVIGHDTLVGYTHLSGEAGLGGWVGLLFMSFFAAVVCAVLALLTRKNGFCLFFISVTLFFLGMTVSCFMPI